jgi:arsenite transporter
MHRNHSMNAPSPTSSLSFLDRYLPLWIFAAMAFGIGLGRVWPTLGPALETVKIAGVSAPIAVGLFAMMYPVLAKVKYGQLGRLRSKRKLFATSLLLNWVIGPLVMFALAWVLLADLPHYRTGLILIGLARCIAMVLLWNQLAGGSNELGAVLVALNSVFQIVAYAVLGWVYLTVSPTWLGGAATALDLSMSTIAKSVLLFLGVPFAAGLLTRVTLVRARGEVWYEERFAPRIGPIALVGLLYTIVLMFAMQGDKLVRAPFAVLRIALPLGVYFLLMFLVAFALGKLLAFPYEETASLAFTAAGNNFELAIAVAVGVFGIASGEALAGVVGPLIEVPALLALVYLSLWLRRFFPQTPSPESSR